jgi:hypothetical protein
MDSHADVLNCLALIVGVVLTVRALVRMDHFHPLRVALLTAFLFGIFLYVYHKINVFPEPMTCIIESQNTGNQY